METTDGDHSLRSALWLRCSEAAPTLQSLFTLVMQP